jgi:hypothetical protein
MCSLVYFVRLVRFACDLVAATIAKKHEGMKVLRRGGMVRRRGQTKSQLLTV